MSYFVRKISHSRYYKIVRSENIHDVEADVVSNDLRTTKNCLSTWKINDPNEVDNAILAIASTSDHIEKMAFLLLDESHLIDNELEIEDERDEGCPVADMASAHANIANLSYRKIGTVLGVVKNIPDAEIITRTKPQIFSLINDAKNCGRLDVLKLKEDVMKYISPQDYSRIYGTED